MTSRTDTPSDEQCLAIKNVLLKYCGVFPVGAIQEVYLAARSENKTPNLDGQDFYELCQEYRHAKIDAAPQFANLIAYIKTGKLPWPSYEE